MALRIALIASALMAPLAAGTSLRDTKTKFTINDKVFVDGVSVSEGSALGDALMCHEFPKGTSSFKVCGCGVKVVAHLMTECHEYGKYSHTVGKCDCGTTECDDTALETGYTEKFNWKAMSYEIVAC